MMIPKGATHRSAGHYYRKTLMEWLVFSSRGWISSDCHPVWLSANAEPIFDQREKTVQAIADVLSSTVSRDTRQQAAEAIYAAGYRKFEIVEEDV